MPVVLVFVQPRQQDCCKFEASLVNTSVSGQTGLHIILGCEGREGRRRQWEGGRKAGKEGDGEGRREEGGRDSLSLIPTLVILLRRPVICHQDNIYLLGCRPGEDAKNIISPKEQLPVKLSFFLDPASKFKDPG